MTNTTGAPNASARFEDHLALLATLLDGEGSAATNGDSIPRRADFVSVPMSFAQELVWALDRANPGMTAYNIPLVRRLRGSLDVAGLERSLTAIVARHEPLRTRLLMVDGQPVQVVDPPPSVGLRVFDLRAISPVERETQAEGVVDARARAPFDLERDHMFRATLVRMDDADQILVIETHHIVFDGWSIGVFYRELAACYAAAVAGREPELAPLPIRYGDYAIWQRQRLTGDRLARLLDYWRTQLGDALDPLGLPSDRPRTSAPSFVGGRRSVLLPAPMLAQIVRLGQQYNATLYMTLLAAYMIVLHRYTARERLLVGSGIAGRIPSETEGLIGYFNNLIVQRGDFAGDPTVAELLGRVREACLGAYDHQEVPLEKLVLELRSAQERLSDAPLFEVVFTMQDVMAAPCELVGLDVEPYGVDLGGTKFDLTLQPLATESGLWLTLRYRSELFDDATGERLLGHMRQVLEGAIADPGQRVSSLPLLSPAERAEIAGWNAMDASEGAAATVTTLFETAAARTPSRAAVVAADGTLSYGELDARANQLAHRLRELGVTGGDTPVGLTLDRSTQAVVGLLGILKAGAAYVPLPPHLPLARLAKQLGESGARVVVALAAHLVRLPAGTMTVCLDRDADVLAAEPTVAPGAVVTPESLAYVLFTSGSTGVPKGVAVTHRNLVHYTRAISRVFADMRPEEPGDGLAALATWHFGLVSTLGADLGNTSLYPALASGATLHMLDDRATTEPSAFTEYMAEGTHALDVVKITPNHLRALIAGRVGTELATVLPARWLVLGGEALSWDLAERLVGASRGRTLNHYGPTETTVGACTLEVTAAAAAAARAAGAQTVPIGRPLANTRCAVLDGRGQPVPIGVPGELFIGGAGVSAGYFHRADLTADRFVHLAEIGRVYRTGDRVRWRRDGTLEFLGRVDDQVKLRGYRVELGDIEQTLARHAAVRQVAVVLSRGASDAASESAEPRLVAYVVAASAGAGGYALAHGEGAGPERLEQRLREWLVAELPPYMMPTAIVVLDAMPLTANGKVDRQELQRRADADGVGGGPGASADVFVAPRTVTERDLASIWSEVLKKEPLSVTADFLALGGHSLLAIRILGKISRRFGVRLALRALFDAPTIERLAKIVEAEVGTGSRSPDGGGRSDAIKSVSRDAYRMGVVAAADGGPDKGPPGVADGGGGSAS